MLLASWYFSLKLLAKKHLNWSKPFVLRILHGSLALDARAKRRFSKSDMLRNFTKW
jgi:DNA polymerase III delta subunit